MTAENHRYVQPQSVKEAMELIQKLFNQYRNAPLTTELVNYHANLLSRLQGDILREAKREGNQKQLKDLQSMTEVMQSWTRIRLSGRAFPGKMKHFHLVTGPEQHFKTQTHKIGGSGNHRASRH